MGGFRASLRLLIINHCQGAHSFGLALFAEVALPSPRLNRDQAVPPSRASRQRKRQPMVLVRY